MEIRTEKDFPFFWGRKLFLFVICTSLAVALLNPMAGSFGTEESRVLAVARRMESGFKALQDYTCEVEQVFYHQGAEEQRQRFKFYYKKDFRIRVDFSSPYPFLTLFYNKGEKEATVVPLRNFSAVRFHPSIDNPRLKTLAGQRIDQTHMGYFIDFLLRNLETVVQKEDEFQDEGDRIRFVVLAKDYIEEKMIEKYRISVSKKHWLPVRIERYAAEDLLLEMTNLTNYAVDIHLDDKVFEP
jgi:outer membrane lipoprotein-sorting protein